MVDRELLKILDYLVFGGDEAARATAREALASLHSQVGDTEPDEPAAPSEPVF